MELQNQLDLAVTPAELADLFQDGSINADEYAEISHLLYASTGAGEAQTFADPVKRQRAARGKRPALTGHPLDAE